MSDNSGGSVPVEYVNVGDRYAYPNPSAYWRGGGLVHGQIFTVFTKDIVGQTQTATSPTSGTVTWASNSQVNTTLYKMFQYNPAELRMDIGMAPVTPSTADQKGGAQVQGVGAMSLDFEMRFTREQEVFAAFSEYSDGAIRYGLSPAEAAIYRSVGVQKDIYDVLRVILGDTEETNTLPKDMSMRAFTQKLFDLSVQGGAMYGRPVFVQFNPNLAFFGIVRSFNIVYNKFNNKLVPVYATTTMSLDVMNAAPTSQLPTNPGAVTNAAGGTAATGATINDPGLPPSSGPIVNVGGNVTNHNVSQWFGS